MGKPFKVLYLVILTIALAFLVAVILFIAIREPEPDDPCIRAIPQVAVSGSIWSHKTVYYYLRYEGKREVSGAACTVSVRVTESEYERQMYTRPDERTADDG